MIDCKIYYLDYTIILNDLFKNFIGHADFAIGNLIYDILC